MAWLFTRSVVASALTAGGVLAGALAGEALGWPRFGSALAGAAVALVFAVADRLHGARLLRWLSSPLDTAPPLLWGFWGEVGVRVERAVRMRERDVLAEQERLAQFLNAIEASPNGVLLLDANEHIEWCNRVAADHLGLDPRRDLLQRVTNLVRSPAFVEHLQGRLYGQPVRIPGPRGRGVLSVLVRPYGDGQRLLLTQDVTERERVDATRRDFVANVSHEIRTPLTVLSGFVETMASLPLSEVERQRVLVLMGQQTRRMQALVGDLLTLAKLEGSARPGGDSWVTMDRIGSAVEPEARALSAGRHELLFNWAPELSVACNEGEWVSAVTNLVNNAVRYTPAGGHIRVNCELREEGGLDLSVQDTGPGIAPEHLPRLTERFYRVDSSRSRDTGGTGLGLSIVKHTAMRHGGELVVASELGRGSSFTLRMPASRVRAAAPVAAKPQALAQS